MPLDLVLALDVSEPQLVERLLAAAGRTTIATRSASDFGNTIA